MKSATSGRGHAECWQVCQLPTRDKNDPQVYRQMVAPILVELPLSTLHAVQLSVLHLP